MIDSRAFEYNEMIIIIRSNPHLKKNVFHFFHLKRLKKDKNESKTKLLLEKADSYYSFIIVTIFTFFV